MKEETMKKLLSKIYHFLLIKGKSSDFLEPMEQENQALSKCFQEKLCQLWVKSISWVSTSKKIWRKFVKILGTALKQIPS